MAQYGKTWETGQKKAWEHIGKWKNMRNIGQYEKQNMDRIWKK